MAQYCIAELKFDDDGKLTVERAFAPGQITQVVHAHWIRWREPKVTNPVYKCSNCEFDITVDEAPNIDIGFWIEDFKYCLHCGAKMDEVI